MEVVLAVLALAGGLLAFLRQRAASELTAVKRALADATAANAALEKQCHTYEVVLRLKERHISDLENRLAEHPDQLFDDVFAPPRGGGVPPTA